MLKERKEKKEPKGKGEYLEDQGKIQARVSDFAHGLRIYNNVRLLRIKSKDYTLLIMEDYFPLVGSVNGTVELITHEDRITMGHVEGFFMHRDNEFSLLIEKQVEKPVDPADETEEEEEDES